MILSLLLFFTNAVVAQCRISRFDWQGDNIKPGDYIRTKSDFLIDIDPGNSTLTSIDVLIDGANVKSYQISKLKFDDPIYILKSSIGPKLSGADIIIPYGTADIEVNITTANGCTADSDIRVRGADSGVRAIIVGISKYQNLKQLNYAHKDAERIKDYLQKEVEASNRTFSYVLLTEERAIRKKILTAIESAGEKLSNHGTLFVYFSGHGMISNQRHRGKKAFLVPWDGEPNSKASSISHDDLLEEIGYVTAINKIVILDSCFSGITNYAISTKTEDLNAKLITIEDHTNVENWAWLKIPSNVVWISASSLKQPSYESKQLKHGVFTYYLLDSVKNATDGRSRLSYDEVITYIKEKVDNLHDSVQSPSIWSSTEFVKSHFWAEHSRLNHP